jgi:hypothetical protein
MPGLDGTGPMGMGPMTGGGFGKCASQAQDGSNSVTVIGRGFGCRGGRGRGRGRSRGTRLRQRLCSSDVNNIPVNIPAKNETSNSTEYLEEKIKNLENSLYEIKRQMDNTNQPIENQDNS